MTASRVGILTLHPLHYGGILSLMRFLYSLLEKEDFTPTLFYLSMNHHDHVSLKKLLTGRQLKVGVKEETHFGMKGVAVGVYFQRFEAFHYLLNYFQWKKVLRDIPVFFAVGGTTMCALPLALLGKKFTLWVASPYMDDREARVKDFPLWMRILDSISMPLCLVFEKFIFKRAYRIFALSTYVAKYVEKRIGPSTGKMEVVPYPIDVEHFSSDGQREGNVILCVGRINDPRKNIPLLLRAFSFVIKEIPSATLSLVGDDPAASLRALSEKLGVTHRIKFLGWLKEEDLIRLYRTCSLLVLPSEQEGLGIVLLEAMACGTPVVATRCGGPEDVVKDGETGYLVSAGSTEELSRAILKVLGNKELREKMGHQARQHIVEKYSHNSVVPLFIRAMKDISDAY